MNENEKISIIVPVYNVEKYINECIESLLHQTYKNLEIILVDDGSKDCSGEICDSYAQADKRVFVVHKENGGLVSARKAGMERATGKYILNIDGDDYISLLTCEKMHDVIVKDDVDIVQCNYMRVFENGNTSCKENWGIGKKILDDEGRLDVLRSWMVDHDPDGLRSQIVTKLFRREVFIENYSLLPNDMSYGEDVSSFLYFIKNVNSYSVINQPYYYYRVRSGSVSHSLEVEKVLSKEERLINYQVEVMKKLYSELGEDIIFKWSLDRRLRALRIAYNAYDISISKVEMNVNEKKTTRILKESLEKYKKVYIYGAGIIGKRLFRWMYHNGIEKEVTFVVTSLSDTKELFGRSIIPVSDLTIDSDSIVVVAASKEYTSQISELLQYKGIDNILVFNDEIRSFLRESEG